MNFAQIEAEFAGHVAAIVNAKPAAKAARQANKAVIALLPAYEAAYTANVAFSTYVAEKHGVNVRTVQLWMTSDARKTQRREKQRIARALAVARKKLANDKSSRSSKSKSQPIRLEVVEQAILAYAELTPQEQANFVSKIYGQPQEG